MHLNFTNLRPRTRMYSIRYKSRIICKKVGNIKTVPSSAVRNIRPTSNKWKIKSKSNTVVSYKFNNTRRVRQAYLQSSLTFYKFRPIQVDTDVATEAGSGDAYGVNPKLYEHLCSMRHKIKQMKWTHVKHHSSHP